MVDAKGRPRDIEVVSSDHQYFSVAATNSLKKWRFTPGLKEGNPVSCRIQLPFVFRSNL
jgi:TonB family protein